ncbi:MAG TPA: LysR substrate-binding domain-containing protein [Burkholderiales bacterium]|nr:LysR substrate-binding domain-containing protein [Burkholderiales bacterium]
MTTLDADSLTFLHAIACEASLSAASKRLGVTRSALSHRLRDIERKIGASLFHRTTRRLLLTETGEALFTHAEQIATHVQEANVALQDSLGVISGHLRVTAPPVLGRVWLGPMVDRFLEKYPDITAEVELTDRQVDLMAERFDLAVRVAKSLPQDAVAYPLRKMRWLLCASKRYLDQYGTPKNLEDLQSHRYLCFSRAEPDQRLRARIVGKPREISLKPFLTCNDDEVLLRAVRSGHGLCVFPDYLVEEDIESGTLQVLLRRAEIESGFGSMAYVIFAQHRVLPAKIRAFLDHLRASDSKAE